MHRTQHLGNLWLHDQYGALIGAQARIANTITHTEALLAAAMTAMERTKTTLDERPAVPPAPQQPVDRARG